MPVTATIPQGYRDADVQGDELAYWVQSAGRMPFGDLPLFAVVARWKGRTATLATQCHLHHAIHLVNALRAHEAAPSMSGADQ